MIDLNQIAAILSDPVTDAIARAAMARLGYPYTEPVAVLRRADAIRVVVRVSRSKWSRHSNRFVIVNEMGTKIWTTTFCGLSDVAHSHGGWLVIAIDDDTKGTAERLKNRLPK